MSIENREPEAKTRKDQALLSRHVQTGEVLHVDKMLFIAQRDMDIVFGSDAQGRITAEVDGSTILEPGGGTDQDAAIANLVTGFADSLSYFSSEEGSAFTEQELARREQLLQLFTLGKNPQMEMSPEERDAWKEVM